jgi:parvulin-like peptidyl-prolyl isomerase
VGSQNEFFGAAFRLTSPGQVSDVVATDRTAYVIRLVERRPAEEKGFSSEKDAIKSGLANQKRSQAFAAWFEDLKKRADIADNRYMFFSEY